MNEGAHTETCETHTDTCRPSRIALDCGEGKHHVVKGPDDSAATFKISRLADVIASEPRGSILVAEDSLSSFSVRAYNDLVARAEERGVEVRLISTMAVKNFYKDNGIKSEEQSDERAAQIIWHLFFERGMRSDKAELQPLPDVSTIGGRLHLLRQDAVDDAGYPREYEWLSAYGLPCAPETALATAAAYHIRESMPDASEKQRKRAYKNIVSLWDGARGSMAGAYLKRYGLPRIVNQAHKAAGGAFTGARGRPAPGEGVNYRSNRKQHWPDTTNLMLTIYHRMMRHPQQGKKRQCMPPAPVEYAPVAPFPAKD